MMPAARVGNLPVGAWMVLGMRTNLHRLHSFWTMAVGLGLTVWFTAAVAYAQSDARALTYVTPFPENDTYQVVLIGDSLAEPLLDTLPEALPNDGKVVLRRPLRQVYGLIRPESAEELRKIEDALKSERSHIAVVFVGADERQPLRLPNGRRIGVTQTQWREEYGRRIDQAMKLLKRYNLATYWVGQPIVRRSDWNDDVQVMNEIVREKALLNQIRYVDIYQAFADDEGNYNSRGPDVTGRERVLREGDGVHLTMAGARKLAHFIEREMRRDISQAKQERVVPLAGDEAEQ